MQKTLFTGNDINNITPNNSWHDLLEDIVKFCEAGKLVTHFENKPFPLLYEEIFLKSLKQKHRNERDLKNFIASKVSQINGHAIHQRIRESGNQNIITTNYEFTLIGETPQKNNAVISEKLYSVFRNYEKSGVKYWHIHGDCRNPASINLGFEHYGGQLQQIRNYVVSGTNYTNKKLSKLPLIKRLETKKLNGESWIDLFFTTDVYIFGLALDFVETDLWWLLTYRARQVLYKKHKNIKNKIYYFIPHEYLDKSRSKIDLLLANDIVIVDHFSGKNKSDYYNNVLDFIAQKS